ncbi:MAG: tetratricopeptide repeat protein [Acidobacteriota bacterium]|nr:MAG: tetratricopeptide repeat protein [Acidobacteriota bacterium]
MLLAVHVLIAAHITHYLLAGRSVSPVEPSEAMYTLELGEVNAGFLFLLVALAGTLIFGRFFCGWGCHLVALQDIAGWMMKKLGIRPRPFRSRLMMLVPLVVALYMFVWPTVNRFLLGNEPFPGFTNHLLTSSFWKTFPGPLFTVLTAVSCGFAAVYFLGAKGFCTYGCPYGAFFGAVDRLSPGRIVANDACQQCGHCTATCTSNVLVHEEIRLYRQVVDPGCMKCMDCVSVCPNDALRFSFSRPALLVGRPAGKPRAKRFALPIGQEVFLGAVCLAGTLSFRGLYDGFPLLMSVGLGGITAFLSIKLWHLWRRPTVKLQNLALKAAGRISRSGWVFAGLTSLWLLFGGHSALVQWDRAWGAHYLDRTEAARSEVLSGSSAGRLYSEQHQRATERAFEHFSRADRWGLVGVAEIKLGLAWTALLRGEIEAGIAHVREAISLTPKEPAQHDNLIELLIARGRAPEAIEAIQAKMLAVEPRAEDHFQLGGLLAESGRHREAVDAYRACLALDPDNGPAHYNLGGLLRRLGQPAAAIDELLAAAEHLPADADTQIELGLAHAAVGDRESAISALRRAIDLDSESPESRLHLPRLIRELQRSD